MTSKIGMGTAQIYFFIYFIGDELSIYFFCKFLPFWQLGIQVVTCSLFEGGGIPVRYLDLWMRIISKKHKKRTKIVRHI